uniref:Uncharacterized protein n=1 Tax=viral metagenome TaxID=1070528 RepID=A0A6M3L6I5_9ZZZZ
MLIKYTGTKDKKVVEYAYKQFEFTPALEVKDEGLIKFLLHPERKGLFTEVKEEKIEEVTEEVINEIETPIATPKVKKRKRRKVKK